MKFSHIIILVLIIYSNTSLSATKIDITKGSFKAIPIAINDFKGSDIELNDIANHISLLVADDLMSSGMFRLINKESFIEKLDYNSNLPNFSSWRLINADAITQGKVDKKSDGTISVEYKLWNPYRESLLSNQLFTAKSKSWRVIAHKIADDIYFNLTGEEGYFNSKIVYIAEQGPFHKRQKRLAIMDQDGANIKYIGPDKYLVLTPRFSPDATKLLYLSYIHRKPKVYLFDLKSGNEKLVGDFPGMTYAPRFSPSGKEALIALASKGISNIYLINLDTLVKKQLTNGLYIDTTPYFSPDGTKIVFSSDRSGRNQLYIMDQDGNNQKRISFGEGSYNTPVWSPRGDYIAFTKIYKGQFHIGLIRPDGTGERILTAGYMVEGPSWSPNGRVIVFTRAEKSKLNTMGRSKLQSIDITGNFEREIITPTEASDPSWSPLIR